MTDGKEEKIAEKYLPGGDTKSGFVPQFAKKFGAKFSPKKSVKSFRDLDVYRVSLKLSVDVVKYITPVLEEVEYPMTEGMRNTSMGIPLLVADAHSIRFADLAKGMATLERAMQGCNKMVVYLEQSMELYPKDVDVVLVENLMKGYIDVRGKMFRLMKAWKKWATRSGDYG